MKEISLTQELKTQVDDEDYERLNRYKWYARKEGNTHYAGRNSAYVNGKQKTIRMHRKILETAQGLQTDHIDGNGLNNQKSNLRVVTHRQNCQNKKNIVKTSQYPGVNWDKRRNKWLARIVIDGTQKFIGYFILEIDAFEAYRKAVTAIGEKVVKQKPGLCPC